MTTLLAKIIHPLIHRIYSGSLHLINPYVIKKDTSRKYLFLNEPIDTEYAEHIQKIGMLSRGIFHDLITPLSSLSMYVEHMNKQGLLRTYRYKKELLASQKELYNFINQVRLFISYKSEPQIVNIAKLCNDTLLLVKHRTIENNITLMCAYNKPVIFHCIPCRIQQIILVLINNAIDACIIKNKIKHFITLSIHSDTRHIKISVSDTGCGIPTQSQQKRPSSGGCGIGLSHIKQIIRSEYAGDITIEKTDAHGTTISVSFPLTNQYSRELLSL